MKVVNALAIPAIGFIIGVCFTDYINKHSCESRGWFITVYDNTYSCKKLENNMEKEIIIDINPTGKTSGLHFDEFPLGFLGEQVIGRASEIFFNGEKQNWEVILPGEKEAIEPATGFTSYNGARKFEVDWLQACMKANVHPSCTKGIEIATELRENS